MILRLFKLKQPAPQPTKCHACGTVAAEAICHACKTERPAYTALKNLTARERGVQPLAAPKPCRYFPKSLCGCDGRGQCIEPA